MPAGTPQMTNWTTTAAQPGSLRGPGSRPWQVLLGALGSEGHRRNPYQVHGPPCCAGASVVNSGIAGTGNLCQVQRAPFAQGVQASAACPRIPHFLPAALRGREMLALEEGGFCHLSLSQVTWDQSQKCEESLGKGASEGLHRQKFKRWPVHLVPCLYVWREQLSSPPLWSEGR